MSISSTKHRAALIPLVLALLSLTCASPLTPLIERALQSPFEGLPACNTYDTDPTWAKGISRFKDGDGRYIGNDCRAHDCVTDYFLVGTTAAYNDWYTLGPVQCPPKGSCAQSSNSLHETCSSNSIELGFALTGEWEKLVRGTFGIEGHFDYGHIWRTCDSKYTLDTCTWLDQGCHTIWAAQQFLTVHGYKRRTCDSPTGDSSANMPNSAKRTDGRYTRGMSDFEIKLPGTTFVNCDGNCAAGYHPGATPNPDNELVPLPPA